MVGTAEYQVGRKSLGRSKNLSTSQPGVHTTLAPAANAASRTMPMKQWHHIDAAVGLSQRQRRDRAVSRRTQIGVRERIGLNDSCTATHPCGLVSTINEIARRYQT